jgi:hypothetical protein
MDAKQNEYYRQQAMEYFNQAKIALTPEEQTTLNSPILDLVRSSKQD